MLPFCLHSRKPVEHTGISVQLCFVKLISYTCTGWRRLIGSLILIGQFPQKCPIFSGSFVENDLQLRGSYESSPPCTLWYRSFYHIYICICKHHISAAVPRNISKSYLHIYLQMLYVCSGLQSCSFSSRSKPRTLSCSIFVYFSAY